MVPQSAPSAMSFSSSTHAWCEPLKDYLSHSLDPTHNQGLCNVTFVSSNNERLSWSGLGYLSSLSPLFKARSEEEQCFTIMIPDYQVSYMRKLLLLLSTGWAVAKSSELNDLTTLIKDLGVRKECSL